MIYHACGIDFDSSLELPELLPADQQIPICDPVLIRYGDVPNMLSDVSAEGPLYQINERQFCFNVPRIARFLVEDGQTIIIQPYDQIDEDSVRLFLLSPVLSVLMHQRKILPIRGSCVETQNGAIILGGISGAGKSTVAAAFQKMGCRLLADDICAIQLGENGLPLVIPSYPRVRLWRDALRALQYPDVETFQRVRPKIQKYSLPLGADFCGEPTPLSAIYILTARLRQGFEFIPIEGVVRLPCLNQLIYQLRFAIQMGRMPVYWNLLATIARDVRFAEIRHTISDFPLATLTDAILKDLQWG
ncbi:MAG: hypothetical protein GC204_05000 [Chloroflexi bacterium]|nr:hypothetical protein [Chloroflexota bacterium]